MTGISCFLGNVKLKDLLWPCTVADQVWELVSLVESCEGCLPCMNGTGAQGYEESRFGSRLCSLNAQGAFVWDFRVSENVGAGLEMRLGF